ncbi:HK97-gp10 family putative phage morphogenesis protein [Zhihengliuella flava]|uniref:HK97 gp10 family phage protein n=1 Tax=Zhihengliuella flava TaxID=1285193 RepID=A0A931DDZ3_9MICC|nr:HK97-gp10 family putative phage morphogenesis protein [Zhihengliuella flava]MBG6085816.1 HK97 gp10 family phage protein [Zhihengliuella flava]
MDTSELARLTADLRGAQARVGPRAQLVVRKTAKDIQRSARTKAPVDTGRLKGSITTSDLRTVGQAGTLAAEVGPTVEYGIYVELGTSRMAAQPYLGPAADQHTPAFEAAMEALGAEVMNG